MDLGLVPDCGLSYFLPRVVGTTRAIEIMTLGEIIPSQKALEWGI
jgi:2-(1,2-epoxy-1,2-dihydrophenyl)acetyl-CoA isomerase